MIAAGACLHMNSIASWSPSQSEPLTVSYMCQRQSSSPMLPSAAEMPPCAATVWLRVGNTLVMQAVGEARLGEPERGAQPGAAGAHDDDVVLVIDDLVVLHGALRSTSCSSAYSPAASSSRCAPLLASSATSLAAGACT